MYKVFFNNKAVLLTEKYNLNRLTSGELFISYDDFEELGFLINLLELSPLLDLVVIESREMPVLWSDFTALFKEIDAAGGIVMNDAGEILMIYREGIWDLPKGKYEEGESIQDCALREVREECGVTDLILRNKIGISRHTYQHKGFRILKHTHWFLMKSNQYDFQPQLEEGITEVRWVTPEEFLSGDFPTYRSIEILLEDFLAANDLS